MIQTVNEKLRTTKRDKRESDDDDEDNDKDVAERNGIEI